MEIRKIEIIEEKFERMSNSSEKREKTKITIESQEKTNENSMFFYLKKIASWFIVLISQQ